MKRGDIAKGTDPMERLRATRTAESARRVGPTGDCEHVTVVQRSPTYFIPARNENDLANVLREIQIDESWIHEIVRRKILHDQASFTRRSFSEPEVVKQELLAGVAAFVGEDETKKNFTPTYRPWRQRIAFVPDGDLFQGVKARQGERHYG